MTGVIKPLRTDAAAFVTRWLTMWNGELDLAEEIIAPALTVHLPQVGMPPAATVHDPKTMAAWIGMFRGSYSQAHFQCELGPFADGEHIVSRFRFTGVWAGGRPAIATAPAGTAVNFAGVDILRLEGGRVAEYWLTDDQLDLYDQLGAVRN
jgi:hypothetical protein